MPPVCLCVAGDTSEAEGESDSDYDDEDEGSITSSRSRMARRACVVGEDVRDIGDPRCGVGCGAPA